MTDRPILFNGPMVRAILDGRKSKTRRVVKGVALEWLGHFTPEFVASAENRLCPFGRPGDRLWVRETFGYSHQDDDINGPGSWDANPWVWVIEFKRVNP